MLLIKYVIKYKKFKKEENNNKKEQHSKTVGAGRQLQSRARKSANDKAESTQGRASSRVVAPVEGGKYAEMQIFFF